MHLQDGLHLCLVLKPLGFVFHGHSGLLEEAEATADRLFPVLKLDEPETPDLVFSAVPEGFHK